MHDEYPGSGVIRRKFLDMRNHVPVKCPDWQTDNDLGSRKRNEKSPEEAVPTRGRILHINRYFIKISRLNQEKPCNLAAFLSPGSLGQFTGNPKQKRRSGPRYCLKNEYSEKWCLNRHFLKWGDFQRILE